MQQFRHRQFPASNPLANALVIVAGVLIIAVSIVLGVVALVAFLAAAIVMGGVIGARMWWLNRKHGTGRRTRVNQDRTRDSATEIIEGEFRVVTHERDEDSRG